MIKNPPTFKISANCCNGAKKNVSKKYLKENNADLNLTGLRKAEGGIRSVAYKNCFTLAKDDEYWDNYRPIFWYSDKDKEEYESLFDVTHSACYTEYGLKRTGCAGCPFGKRYEEEIEICRQHEPKLYTAINNIFGESYEYTRGFLKFREEMKQIGAC
jgi:3'-phosphoadenosine 5'-phosphosulfate sulfotransferase (PAPS reductase)/FAD synthetase